MAHVPVLLQEVIEGLDLKPGDVVIDATLGEGGHSLHLAEAVGPTGTIVGIDADSRALERARKTLSEVPGKLVLLEGNFRDIEGLCQGAGITAADAILFDLGVNSSQLDDDDRGFSFKKETPLLMTLRTDHENSLITAYDVVNTWGQENLADIIYGYGEEGFSRRIAEAIVKARSIAPIKTTTELVAIIEGGVPAWYRKGRLHFATRTFQAIRIAVNDELGALGEGLEAAWQLLGSGGRLAVITFHSLEARPVKEFFKRKHAEGVGQLVVKKAIKPTREEEVQNPRSRSAQLRIIKKIEISH